MTIVTLQPSTQDTVVHEGYKTTNYGSDPTMKVCGRVDLNRRSHVQFDLSSLVGKTILSVYLWLYCETINDIGSDYPTSIAAVRCTAYWDEDTFTWPGPTISGTVLATRAWHKTAGVWVSYGPLNMTEFALMQATNMGMRVWIPAGDEGGNNQVDYATSENGTAGNRPKLVVTYVGAGAQVIWMMSKIQDFFKELKLGRIPSNKLLEQYGDLLAI